MTVAQNATTEQATALTLTTALPRTTADGVEVCRSVLRQKNLFRSGLQISFPTLLLTLAAIREREPTRTVCRAVEAIAPIDAPVT